ncbi:MAG TPA: phosphate acyltransferase [Desulfomonilaceae bacterium]|nr:phosphate acyltransferase [Desulfomonilaceae bacterium]
MAKTEITSLIQEIRESLVEAGYFRSETFEIVPGVQTHGVPVAEKIGNSLEWSRKSKEELQRFGHFILEKVVAPIRQRERGIRRAEEFADVLSFLSRLLAALEPLRTEAAFVEAYAELLSSYISLLYFSGRPGLKSPIIEMILESTCRQKAMEYDQKRMDSAMGTVANTITVAIIAKRYGVYVLATHGFQVLFRSEIDYRTFGKSAEALALQITNMLIKSGIKLSDVTDVVCGGGDLGTMPDGIYILTEKVRDESWRRLGNSSLNMGALIAWELRELLRRQRVPRRINCSLCSPLSFSTLSISDLSKFYRPESRELQQSLKGFVKITPLKALSALLSAIQKTNQETLNLLVMALDELHASVVRKTGPQIVREMATQEANRTLIDFDFQKILEALKQEDFQIPPHFRIGASEEGTGAKEICELIMIVDSGRISPSLARSLNQVVDSYARQVAMVLEMASTGSPAERPHFIVITSMMAFDPCFQKLFTKIRGMIDAPFTPIMCLDSLEHEYLIARHLFEIYLNPTGEDRRLHFSIEVRSMKQALRVLGSSVVPEEVFSFAALLDSVSGSISRGDFHPADLVLVGADNEDALIAVSNAREYGLIDRVALIGDPDDIMAAAERTKVTLGPKVDPRVDIIPIDPLVVDFEQKKKATAEAFRLFLAESQQFIIMKGSLDTAALLRQAFSIYKTGPSSASGSQRQKRVFASHTALLVLPDGRFFALSDGAVNPAYNNSDQLLHVIENQLDVVRTVVDPTHLLKVAIITAVEKETSAIPTTLLAAEAERKAKVLEDRYGPLIVEGPLSFDLATAPDSAAEKHYTGAIKGDANCLVTTEINTANVLYKTLSKTMGSLGLLVEVGAIITAGPRTVPIVLTSRGDTAQTKFNSILLALAYSWGGRAIAAQTNEAIRDSEE